MAKKKKKEDKLCVRLRTLDKLHITNHIILRFSALSVLKRQMRYTFLDFYLFFFFFGVKFYRFLLSLPFLTKKVHFYIFFEFFVWQCKS